MTRKFTHGRIVVELMYVTPEMASAWLDPTVNSHNRPLKGKRFGFSRDMQDKHWTFNGDTIRFGVDGTLLDGQNRLWAIEDSETTQLCLVVSGLELPAQATMDQGTPRSHGDIFHLAGEINANYLASICTLIVPLDKGLGWSRSYAATYAEKKELLERDPKGIVEAVEVANRARATVPAPPSAIGAAYYLAARVNKYGADEFFNTKLVKQLGHREGEPARALLNRLAKHRTDRTRIDADEVIRLTLLAYNHWRRGHLIQKIQGPKGGWTSANFPNPV